VQCSIISESNGWAGPTTDMSTTMMLDETTSSNIRSGKLMFKLLNSIKGGIEEDTLYQAGSSVSIRSYNWSKIFSIVESKFSMALSKEAKELILAGDDSAIADLLKGIKIDTESSGVRLSRARSLSSGGDHGKSRNRTASGGGGGDTDLVDYSRGDASPLPLWKDGELDVILNSKGSKADPVASVHDSLAVESSLSGAHKIADNVTDLLAMSLAYHLEIDKNTCYDMILNGASRQGIYNNENTKGLISWCKEVNSTLIALSQMSQTSVNDVCLLLEVLGDGLVSPFKEVVLLSCTSLITLASMWNLGIGNEQIPVPFAPVTWDWLLHFGLSKILMSAISNTGTRLHLFTVIHSYGSVAYVPLFENSIRPMMLNMSCYFILISDYMEQMNDIILAHSPDLITYFVSVGLEHIDSPKSIGSNPTVKRASDGDEASSQLKALSMLCQIWSLFPIFIEESPEISDGIMTAFKKCWRPESPPAMRINSVAVFLNTFEHFIASKNPFGPLFWQTLTATFIAVRADLDFHRYLGDNIQQFLTLHPSLPVNNFLAQFIKVAGEGGMDNLDFELIISVAKHDSLGDNAAAQLLSFVSTIAINDVCLSRCASVTLLILLYRFHNLSAVKGALLKLVSNMVDTLKSTWSSCSVQIDVDEIEEADASGGISQDARAVLIIELLAKLINIPSEDVVNSVTKLVRCLSRLPMQGASPRLDSPLSEVMTSSTISSSVVELLQIYGVETESLSPPIIDVATEIPSEVDTVQSSTSPNLKHRIVKPTVSGAQMAHLRLINGNKLAAAQLEFIHPDLHPTVRKFEIGLRYIFQNYSVTDVASYKVDTFNELANQNDNMGLGELNRCLKDLGVMPLLISKSQTKTIHSKSISRDGKGKQTLNIEQFFAVMVNVADISLRNEIFNGKYTSDKMSDRVDAFFTALQVQDVKGLWKRIKGLGSIGSGDSKNNTDSLMILLGASSVEDRTSPRNNRAVSPTSKKGGGDATPTSAHSPVPPAVTPGATTLPEINNSEGTSGHKDATIIAKRRVSEVFAKQASVNKVNSLSEENYGLLLVLESYVSAANRELKLKSFDHKLSAVSDKVITLGEWLKFLKDYSIMKEFNAVQGTAIFKRYNNKGDTKWMNYEAFVLCLTVVRAFHSLCMTRSALSPLSSCLIAQHHFHLTPMTQFLLALLTNITP
jgi:hypothetical protein